MRAFGLIGGNALLDTEKTLYSRPMDTKDLGGVIPALVTPFKRDGSVNETVILDMLTYHLNRGVDGFYLCGSTGQGIWITSEERKLVCEVALSHIDGRVPTIIHIGCTAQHEAMALAEHAAENGASAISSIIPPTYSSLEAITGYFKSLASASALPLLPYFMGAAVSPLQIMKSLADVDMIRGTKYTGPNMYEMTQIIEMGEDPWWVFSGMDEQCVFAAMCGASGAIGSSVNIMPGVYKRIRALVAEGKHSEAYELQKRANEIITILVSYGYAGALRRALGILGFQCGDPKPPEKPFESGSQSEMQDRLNQAGFEALSSM